MKGEKLPYRLLYIDGMQSTQYAPFLFSTKTNLVFCFAIDTSEAGYFHCNFLNWFYTAITLKIDQN